MRQLEVVFIVPPENTTAARRCKPMHYLTHLFGHEGKGSILAELRARGWATALSAGPGDHLEDVFGSIAVSVDLSEAGLLHADQVVDVIFDYVSVIRTAGPQRWIWDEIVAVEQLRFLFAEREQRPVGLTSRLASALLHWDGPEALRGPIVPTEYHADIIDSMLTALVPQNCRIVMVAKSLDLESEPASTVHIEPVYSLKYRRTRLTPERIAALAVRPTPATSLALPEPNEFLPTDLAVLPVIQARKAEISQVETSADPAPAPSSNVNPSSSNDPVLLRNDSGVVVWHRIGVEHPLPKVQLFVSFHNPECAWTALDAALLRLHVLQVNEILAECTYAALVGGLSFEIVEHAHGMRVHIQGYNHRALTLLDRVLKGLAAIPEVTQEPTFQVILDRLRRQYSDFEVAEPYQQASAFLQNALVPSTFLAREKLQALAEVDFADYGAFVRRFFRQSLVTVFAHGNVDAAWALSAGQQVEQLVFEAHRALRLDASMVSVRRCLALREGEDESLVKINSVRAVSSVHLYFQIGTRTVLVDAMTDLLQSFMHEPAFKQLRTVEQLGYIVYCMVNRIAGTTGLLVGVQSAYSPDYVAERALAYLVGQLEELKAMPAETFAGHVRAQVEHKLEKPKNLRMHSLRLWGEIGEQMYVFSRSEQEAHVMSTITQAQLIEFFSQCIALHGERRRLLTVRVYGEGSVGDGGDAAAENADEDGKDEGADDNEPDKEDAVETDAVVGSSGGVDRTRPRAPGTVTSIRLFQLSHALLPYPTAALPCVQARE
jgi:insulysin